MQVQQAIDEIRNFVATGQSVASEALRSYAETYGTACREANDRLRRCDDALRRGLRGEAIRLADTEPNLLDLVASLDFPELPLWRRVCIDNGLPDAPGLLIEQAAALNEAYATEQPLASLMAHHRLMALARAPMGDRLRVLRRIAELDPAMPFWEDDVRAMERARVETMREELRTAVKTSDLTTVGRVLHEATASGWRTNVPAELVRTAKDATERFTAAKAIVDLKALLPKVSEAHGAMSHGECKSLLDQWQSIAAAARLTVPAELQEEIDPVFEWVRQTDERFAKQEAFDAACVTLQQAIDTDQPTPALDRAYRATVPFETELSDDLETQYRQRLAMRSAASRQKRRLIYSGIAALFVIVAGSLIYVGYRASLSREVAEVQQSLATALTEVQGGDLEQGVALRKQLTDQHGRVMGNALVAQAEADLDSAVNRETQRRAEFAQQMKAAIAAGVDHPDQSSLHGATALAKLPTEKSQVADWQSQVDAARNGHQQEADHQFMADSQAIDAALQQQASLDPAGTNLNADDSRLASMASKIDELRKRKDVSSGLQKSEIASLTALLNRDQQAITQRRSSRLVLHQLAGAKSADEQASLLKQFIVAFPDDSRSDSFRAAMANSPANKAIEDWVILSKPWAGDIEPAEFDVAKTRAADVQHFIDEHAASPISDSIKQYLSYLQNGLQAAAPAPDGPWKGHFRALLSNPLVHDLKCVTSKSGKRYYLTADAAVQSQEGSQQFDAITTPDVTNSIRIKLDGNDPLVDAKPAASPQAIFATAAAEHVDALHFRGWEAEGIDAIDELNAQHDIDPVLRSILLLHVLQLNSPTAMWVHEDSFQKASDALVGQSVEDIAWLDPRTPEDATVLKNLQNAVRVLPPTVAVRQAMRRQIDGFTHALNLKFKAEHILLKDPSGSWNLATNDSSAAGQTAWIVEGGSKLVRIGHSDADGKWSIDSAAGSATEPEGSLVFVSNSK